MVTTLASLPLGSASIVSATNILLTPNATDKRGSAFLLPKQLVDNAHTNIKINFVIAMNSGGADGMALILQSHSPKALGGGGSGLGYDGIPGPALVLEFDTFHSSGLADPDGMHIAIQNAASARHGSHTLSLVQGVPRMNNAKDIEIFFELKRTTDSSFWTAGLWIKFSEAREWHCVNNTSGVTIPEQFWVGFSAATGGLCQEHHVKNVAFALN